MAEGGEPTRASPEIGMNDPLNIDHLRIVHTMLYKARTKWHNIGLGLSVDDETLRSIKRANSDDGDCLRETLAHRIKSQTGGPLTLMDLCACLRTDIVGRDDIAKEIQVGEMIVDSKKSSIKRTQTRSSEILEQVQDQAPGFATCTIQDEKALSPSSEAAGPEQTAFPYLDVSGLTEEERIALEERLEAETFKIESHFFRLTSGVIKSLEHSHVSLDEFKDFIISLNHIPFSSWDGTGVEVFDKKDYERIKATITCSGVFMIFSKYISFFDYDFIKRIIDHFGKDSDHVKLEDYLEAFEVFCKRNVFEIPHDAFESSARATAKALVLKCTEDVATMKDVVRVRNAVADILQISTVALQLRSIKNGCVELHFLISAAVAERIFPVSPSQHSALSEIGVRVLSFDRKDMGRTIPQEVLSNIHEISPSYDLFHKACEHVATCRVLSPVTSLTTI